MRVCAQKRRGKAETTAPWSQSRAMPRTCDFVVWQKRSGPPQGPEVRESAKDFGQSRSCRLGKGSQGRLGSDLRSSQNVSLPSRSNAVVVVLRGAYPLMEFTSSIFVVLMWR